MKQPQFEKIASCTTGGKPYFYIHIKSKYVVVWNKTHNQWTILKGDWTCPIMFNCEKTAMNFVRSFPT
jgi:hypothetical protein